MGQLQWGYYNGARTIGLTFLTDSYEYSCQSHTNLPESEIVPETHIYITKKCLYSAVAL